MTVPVGFGYRASPPESGASVLMLKLGAEVAEGDERRQSCKNSQHHALDDTDAGRLLFLVDQ